MEPIATNFPMNFHRHEFIWCELANLIALSIWMVCMKTIVSMEFHSKNALKIVLSEHQKHVVVFVCNVYVENTALNECSSDQRNFRTIECFPFIHTLTWCTLKSYRKSDPYIFVENDFHFQFPIELLIFGFSLDRLIFELRLWMKKLGSILHTLRTKHFVHLKMDLVL